jgi:IMP dehydrogenase
MKTFDYCNVFLVPQPSRVNSRDEVDLSISLSDNLKLDIPIIVSPMKGITNPTIVSGINNLGGLGIIHRFQDESSMHSEIKETLKHLQRENFAFGVAIGLDDPRYNMALDYGANVICVDVANGYLGTVQSFCEEVANRIGFYGYDCSLMAGNVVTGNGARNLRNAGVNLIRVGIGTGNLCTTRQVTGVGFGQVTALQSCFGIDGVHLIADGGIRTSGDAVKAIAAGASAVMVGSIIGKTKESSHNGVIMGMASRKLQEEYYHGAKKSIEGIEKEIEKDTTLVDLVSEFTWGMRSAFTYIGAKNITELQQKAEFVEIA